MSNYKAGFRVKLESGYTYWTMNGPEPYEDLVYLQKFVVKPLKDLRPGERFFWGPLTTTEYEFLGREDDVHEFDSVHNFIRESNKILVSVRARNNERIHNPIDVLTLNVHVFVPLPV